MQGWRSSHLVRRLVSSTYQNVESDCALFRVIFPRQLPLIGARPSTSRAEAPSNNMNRHFSNIAIHYEQISARPRLFHLYLRR